MENQSGLRSVATAIASRTKVARSFLILAELVSAAAGAAENNVRIDELKRKLAEREAEVAALKREIAGMQSSGAADHATPPEAGLTAPSSSPGTARSPGEEDDELARALESSLVRQGGAILRPGTAELEPEVAYSYDEPSGHRRDNFGLAVTGRVGLPGAMQAELRVPYVIQDHWSGLGTSSGLGDIQLGLTKELFAGTESAPSLLAFVQWRTTTGDINSRPPTGYGQNAIQLGLTTVKRQDPVVLFGSLSYNANVGAAHLNNGARLRAGDVFGGRLEAALAATPDTSLHLAVTFNSNWADRVNDHPIEGSSRLSSVVELGSTTVVGRGRFLNVSAGFGVTPAAPKFSLAVSLPIRF